MDSETKVFKYGGYHKVDLSKPFIVMKGQSYAIVVTQKTSDKKYAVNVQASNNPDVKGIVNKGESFILIDRKWQDYSSEKPPLQGVSLSGGSMSQRERDTRSRPAHGLILRREDITAPSA